MGLLSRFTFLAGFFACLFFTTAAMAQDATVVRRAAFDIGSAVIKCTVADVDIATGRVIQIIETLSEKVDFAEDLDRSYDSNLSEDIMSKGIEVLETMKLAASDRMAVEFSAAGGSTFREARNGRAYFVRIENETGIHSRVISDQQAAMLSFHAVKQTIEDNSSELIVWDIGGGSMQMTTRDTDGSLQFYLDYMASVSFKNAVIETIQKKNPATTSTPNPVSTVQVTQALAYIKAHAVVAVPPAIKKKIREDNVLMAGIGGVHYYAVPELIGERNPSFTRDEVAQAIAQWTGKADEEFESEYAPVRLTSLILVLGYMDALGIKEIRPLKINQADGLLTAREFW